MQVLSDLDTYTAARDDPSAWHEYKAVIDGVEYDHSVIAGEPETVKTLFPDAAPAIGGCCAQTVKIGIVAPSTPPSRMAEIRLYCRVHGGGIVSEWVPKGAFFIDTRDLHTTPGVLILNGYDAMLKMEETFFEEGDTGEWPRDAMEVMTEIAERIGVELEEGLELNQTQVEYPDDLTMREIASGIAVANAGNWTITDAGVLRLVRLTQRDPSPLGMAVNTFDAGDPFSPITRVTLQDNAENVFTAGTDDGRELTALCPWATTALSASILAEIQGFVYQPFEATDARLDPASELGDWLEINGTSVMLASAVTKMDLLCAADISAPAEEEIDHEIPYQTPAQRSLARKVTLGTSYYGTSITRKEGLVIEKTDGENVTAKAVFNADELSFYDANSNQVLYFDPTTGTYKFKGELNVSDNFIVDANGNVTMNGTITAPNLVVDAANITGTLNANQINMTGAITWNDLSGGVQSTINGAYGSDVPSYIKSNYIDATTIKSPTIEANEFNIFPKSSSDSDGSYNIYGMYDGTQYHFLSISYGVYGATPGVSFNSPDDAYGYWDFGVSYFTGRIQFNSASDVTFRGSADFSRATVTGLTPKLAS